MGSNGPKKNIVRPKMTTNCIIWAKSGRFWAKIANFNRRKQKFWYPHNGKPPRHLVRIVFWLALRPKGPKMPIFGQKCQFWANLVSSFQTWTVLRKSRTRGTAKGQGVGGWECALHIWREGTLDPAWRPYQARRAGGSGVGLEQEGCRQESRLLGLVSWSRVWGGAQG